MLKLKKKHVVPPGGYRYHDDDLNMDVRANTLDQLTERVASLRRLNGKDPVKDLKDVIEDWICQRIPQSFVLGEKPKSQIRQYMPLSVVKAATEVFLTKWRVAGRRYCNNDIALNRARICMECPHNRVNKACLGCKGLTPWVRDWTRRTTHLDDDLLICNCCAVMNVAHIHADKAYIREATTSEMLEAMPKTCWRKQICEAIK